MENGAPVNQQWLENTGKVHWLMTELTNKESTNLLHSISPAK